MLRYPYDTPTITTEVLHLDSHNEKLAHYNAKQKTLSSSPSLNQSENISIFSSHIM